MAQLGNGKVFNLLHRDDQTDNGAASQGAHIDDPANERW